MTRPIEVMYIFGGSGSHFGWDPLFFFGKGDGSAQVNPGGVETSFLLHIDMGYVYVCKCIYIFIIYITHFIQYPSANRLISKSFLFSQGI